MHDGARNDTVFSTAGLPGVIDYLRLMDEEQEVHQAVAMRLCDETVFLARLNAMAGQGGQLNVAKTFTEKLLRPGAYPD